MNMNHCSKDEILAGLARQRALPLFNCGDVATGMQVLEAPHAGGIRFVEFTHRAAGALDVLRGLAAEAAAKPPDMVLGAGTIIDAVQARTFHEAGAAFPVAPNLDEEMGPTALSTVFSGALAAVPAKRLGLTAASRL